MLFVYKIVDAVGQIKEGRVEAVNLKEARNKLALEQSAVISLRPLSPARRMFGKSAGRVISFGHISLLDKVLLAKHLSIMIRSGMNTDEALETIIATASRGLQRKLNEVLADVKAGNRLADALAKHPRDFDMMFINMIAVGESSGRLAENLDILATQQQKSYELKGKIRAASIYPAIILLAVLVLVIVISIFVLPKIVGFFTELELSLPLATRILISTSRFFINDWAYVAGGVIFFIILIKVLASFQPSRLFLHKFILHLPLAGKITAQVNLALFARTLGSLLSSGITIDKGLQIVSRTISNEAYKKETISIYHNVLKGMALSDALAGSSYFPPIFSRMCRVGERSSNLSEVLNHVADFYELEVDNITKNFATILEPALLLFIGLVVAFVAISIINPIYDLTSQVER